MFELKSTGGAREKQNSGLGVFTLESDQVNGRPHYINNNGQHMYWLENGYLLVITKIHCKELIPIMQYTKIYHINYDLPFS